VPSATELCTRALQLAGVVSPVDTPSAEDLSTAFSALNDWIDALGTERLSIYYVARTVKTLANGTPSYTIGSGGSINIARPLWIENAGLVINTADTYPVEIPIRVMTDDEWASRAQKTLPSNLILGIWYDHNWSAGLGLIYVWPIPNVSTTQLVLYTPTAITEFADRTTNYTFPPGIRRMLLFNLANELAPWYPAAQPDPRVPTIATQSLHNYKRGNLRLSEVYVDRAISQQSGRSTVTASQFRSGNF
jgi:hypothetical protein